MHLRVRVGELFFMLARRVSIGLGLFILIASPLWIVCEEDAGVLAGGDETGDFLPAQYQYTPVVELQVKVQVNTKNISFVYAKIYDTRRMFHCYIIYELSNY